MEIGKLLDMVGKEENIYALVVKLSQKAHQLRDKGGGLHKEIGNPVVIALEEELAARSKNTVIASE